MASCISPAAYKTLLRWKVDIAKTIAPQMAAAGYGRILFIESSAVKQPLENLVLSNSLRLASVGFAKTYALEIAKQGVTINIIAPGSHNTDRLNWKDPTLPHFGSDLTCTSAKLGAIETAFRTFP